jgi:hypothetical protein
MELESYIDKGDNNMIHIRYGLFESNSSSANVLIIPKNQGVHVPKRFIYVDDETSTRASELVIYKIIHGWKSGRENIDKLINFIYISGVEEIIYGGHDPYFERAIEQYKDHPEDMGVPDGWNKEVLKFAIFGTESEVQHFSEGESRPNYVAGPDYGQIDDDLDNWYKEYYAD